MPVELGGAGQLQNDLQRMILGRKLKSHVHLPPFRIPESGISANLLNRRDLGTRAALGQAGSRSASRAIAFPWWLRPLPQAADFSIIWINSRFPTNRTELETRTNGLGTKVVTEPTSPMGVRATSHCQFERAQKSS